MSLWKAHAWVILFLFLVACYSGTSRTFHGETNDSCFLAPAGPRSWDLRKLPPDLLEFYRALASEAQVSPDRLLGNLAANYEARDYTVEEFYEVLRSLRHLLVTSIPREDYTTQLRIPNASLLPGRLSDDPAILFVDPTCDACQRILGLIVRIQTNCPNSSPPLELIVVPGGDENSTKAVAALRRIGQVDPDAYAHAVVEFLTLLPESPDRLDDLAPVYLGENYEQSEQFLAELTFLQGARQRERTRDLHTPLLLYRGRVIAKDTSNVKPFDPFRDHEVLALTFRLILLLDAEKRSLT